MGQTGGTWRLDWQSIWQGTVLVVVAFTLVGVMPTQEPQWGVLLLSVQLALLEVFHKTLRPRPVAQVESLDLLQGVLVVLGEGGAAGIQVEEAVDTVVGRVVLEQPNVVVVAGGRMMPPI